MDFIKQLEDPDWNVERKRLETLALAAAQALMDHSGACRVQFSNDSIELVIECKMRETH